HAAGGRMAMPVNGTMGLVHRPTMGKPVIAAVNGIAMGAGFETALSCDIIIASDKAVFSLAEPRVGLVGGDGCVRLPRMIGMQRAMSIILTARHVQADEAKELGFVTEVTRPEALMETALKW